MKLINILFIFSILFSCNNKKLDIDAPALFEQNKVPNNIIPQEINNPEQITDTMSFEYFASMTDEYGEIPKSLIDSFLGPDWYDDTDPYRAFYGDDDLKHYLINGNTVLSLNNSTGGVCSNVVLATFNQKCEVLDHLYVAQYCDADLSSASYTYYSYSIYADTLVETYKHTTQAIDYKYTLPDSVDWLDDVDTKEIVEYKHYILGTDGFFKNIRFTKEIYNEQELQKLDKMTLRLMRNEFFARYGYIFKSKDLQNYFSNKAWYDPKYTDVSEKLTAFEVYNIEIIKKIEDSK